MSRPAQKIEDQKSLKALRGPLRRYHVGGTYHLHGEAQRPMSLLPVVLGQTRIQERNTHHGRPFCSLDDRVFYSGDFEVHSRPCCLEALGEGSLYRLSVVLPGFRVDQLWNGLYHRLHAGRHYQATPTTYETQDWYQPHLPARWFVRGKVPI